MLTTGQIAKACKITIRSVQFYDRENILKPSTISEGGRRLYTDDDVVKLKYICLYRSLGFSLDEIKQVILQADSTQIISTIKDKQKEIDDSLEKLTKSRQQLSILEEMMIQGTMNLESLEQLESIFVRKEKFIKNTNRIYMLLAVYFLILFLLIYMAQPLNTIKMCIILAIALVFLFAFVYAHAMNTAYYCSNCHKKFSLNIWKDLCTIHDNKKGKKTVCPYCKHKGWFQETYRE